MDGLTTQDEFLSTAQSAKLVSDAAAEPRGGLHFRTIAKILDRESR